MPMLQWIIGGSMVWFIPNIGWTDHKIDYFYNIHWITYAQWNIE